MTTVPKTLVLAALAVVAAVAVAPGAWAAQDRPDAGATTPQGEAPEARVQLAQAYEFDVYIDQYGREIIVDPRNGEVVAIRPPGTTVNPGNRQRDGRERDRRLYDFTNPGDVERFQRDREIMLGRREPPIRGEEGGYRDGTPPPEMYDDRLPERLDPDGFPEAPLGRRDNSVERRPLGEPPGNDGFNEEVERFLEGDRPGEGEPEDAERGPDDDGSFASLPENEAAQEEEPRVEPWRRGEGAIVAPSTGGARESVARFQVLLDRAGASPGVIDGRIGDNVNKAIDAYREITGQRLRTYDDEWIEAELEATGGPALVEYTITPKDAAGSFIASVPSDYGEKARLDHLGYTSVAEMLAERFHMSEAYLMALNPDADFTRAGTVITVASPGEPPETKVSRIVADKAAKQVRAYDEGGDLVAAYPATIGSADTPSPDGTHTVERIAFDPDYTYNPDVNFRQGDNDGVLKIPPGPNGPVGSIWIALSKPTYGIHGSPDPDKIGKTFSHGCVRLTNWDARELAGMVEEGVTVEFAE